MIRILLLGVAIALGFFVLTFAVATVAMTVLYTVAW